MNVLIKQGGARPNDACARGSRDTIGAVT